MDEISGHKKALLIQLCKSSDPEIVKYGVPVLYNNETDSDYVVLTNRLRLTIANDL